MKKLLIAEDEKVFRTVLQDRFEEDGWKVKAVDDGKKALSAMKKDQYDLILLDMVMPNMTGFDVLGEMKKDDKLSGTPVIVLSSLESDEDIQRALKLGASDFYVKTEHPVGEVLEKAKKFASGDRTTNKYKEEGGDEGKSFTQVEREQKEKKE